MKQTIAEPSNISIEPVVESDGKNKIKSKRFKILNEETSFNLNRQVEIGRSNSINFIQKNLVTETASIKKNFNIYDYYSNSNFEPMHKIKL